MDITQIADAIKCSDYHISATGLRGLGYDELIEFIKIIRSNNADTIKEKLQILYEYHPDTIELSRYQQKQNCNKYDEYLCDCFFPDVEFNNCYCEQKRKEFLKTTDYRNTPEYSEWRKSVFKRDKYTCQDCDQTGGILNAHHIKTFKKYPEHRYDIDNGITLCVDCHRERHRGRV